MKNQYFGDVNDYRKYGILRCLAAKGGLSIGVCWMLTPNDGRSDGRFTEYLVAPAKYRRLDPPLFDALYEAVRVNGRRDVALAPERELIPGAVYFDREVPASPTLRSGFVSAVLDRFRGIDLMFFDPDNGIEVKSVSYGARESPKYVYWAELVDAFRDGHSILVYQHYPREKRDTFDRRMADEIANRLLSAGLRPADLYALRTSSVVYFLIVQIRHAENVSAAIAALRAQWLPEIRPVRLADG